MTSNETQPTSNSAAPASGRLAGFFGNPQLRELFRWCLPALIVGALLRIALTVEMPYGYVQYDTSDYVTTTRAAITEHVLHIHPKRSFLTPVLFSLPFVLPVPALLIIPAAQHLMGLVAILLTGALVRLWFKHWKWFIVPATLLVGASPMIIWYEHTLLGEAQYFFFTLAAALAGTYWFKHRSRLTFGIFMASLVLVTGTRLEGKVFFLVALALVPFVFWGQWRAMLKHAAIVAVLTVAGFAASGGRDGSPLLVATLLHLAPDHFKSVPALEPYLIPMRNTLRRQWPEYPGAMVKTSKQVSDAVDKYFSSASFLSSSNKNPKAERARLLRALSLEILRARPVEVLELPLIKFRLSVDAWSAYCFNEEYLHQRQWLALTNPEWMAPVLSKGLTGYNQTPEMLWDWVNSHYDAERVQWFTNYQAFWNNAVLYFRTPDRPTKYKRWVHDFFGGVAGGQKTIPGIPYFYPLALVGMLAASLRWRHFGCFHLMWAGCMLAIWYTAMMVGVTNGRFRFAYEPFCALYILLLLECLFDAVKALFSARPSNPPDALP